MNDEEKYIDNVDLSWNSLDKVQINFIEMRRQCRRINDISNELSLKMGSLVSAVTALANLLEGVFVGELSSCKSNIEKMLNNIVEKMTEQTDNYELLNEEIRSELERKVNQLFEYVGLDAYGNKIYDSVYEVVDSKTNETVDYGEIRNKITAKDFSDFYPEGASTLFDGSYTKEEFRNMLASFGETLGNNVGNSCVMTTREGFQQNILPNADDFYEIAVEKGLDPTFIVSIACLESGYGSSWNAVNKGNLFGMGAFDSNPSNAFTYDSVVSGIEDVCNNLADNYITPGGMFYTGPDISAIGRTYATEGWAPLVSSIMGSLKKHM